MKKPKIFALFFVFLLLQRPFTLGSSEIPIASQSVPSATSSAFAAAESPLDNFHTVIDHIPEIFGDKATSQPISQFLKGLTYLGGAFAVLGLFFSLIDFFNPQPDPLDTIIEMLKDMEESILKELGEKFAFLENDNLKNLYYESERHIKDAAKYLSRMSQAKQEKDTELYALFHLAFMKRVEASGIDDLETIISIFSDDTYFISQPFLENIIDTYQGDYTKIDGALKVVTILIVQGFLNLQTYIALSDEENRELKDGNQQLSNTNQELSNGLARYQDESILKLIAYVKTLKRLQKERLQGYLEANLKTFMTNNCKPQTQREQPCATAINKQLDEAFGNLFKFTTFCMNKDVKKNYYKGVDMFAVQDVYNMDCVIFWSSPNYNYTESDPNELRALSDQNFNYHKLEDWDQYVILPKDTKHNQWPGFNSTYPSFNIYQNEPSQKMVWGRYRERRPGVCRLNIINALEHGQDEYDLDNMVKYFDEFNRTWDLETLPGDLNDKVLGLYFYGEGCDICSVEVFQDAYYEGNSKIFYPEPSSDDNLTISRTGYGDTFLAKASSLRASCTLPTSQCKFVFGENSSQDRQDSFEFNLTSGQSKAENLTGNGRRNDLNNNVSWLRLIGDCDGCRVDAYEDLGMKGSNRTYNGTAGYTFVQNSFLNTQISSYFAQC